jgi:hypothetical protein
MARNRLTSEDWDANFHQPNGTFGVACASWAPDIPIGRCCIRTPRLQSGMTLDTEIGVSVRWPQEFTQPGARSDDAVHRPLGMR